MQDGAACPISGVQVDLHVACTNALVVFAALAVALVLPEALGWLPLALAADFAVKVLAGPRWSPVCRVAGGINRLLGVSVSPGDAAPKRFAAVLGLLFSSAAGLCWLAGWMPGFLAASGMLAACAFLEGAAGFCLGCWMYGLLPRRG